jgi:hypothetical protein
VRPSATAVEVQNAEDLQLPSSNWHGSPNPWVRRSVCMCTTLKNMSCAGINGVGQKHGFMQEQPVLGQPEEQARLSYGLRPLPALQRDSILRRENAAQFSRCQVWFIHEAAHMQLLVDPGSHMSSNRSRRPFSPTELLPSKIIIATQRIPVRDTGKDSCPRMAVLNKYHARRRPS